MKNIDIQTIIASIKSAVDSATESAGEITKDKILTDITGFTIELCHTKKILCDIQDYINLNSATRQGIQIDRLTRLGMAINYLQEAIESLNQFSNSNT